MHFYSLVHCWEDYDVIYYTGGHGVMWDFLNNAD